MAQRFAQLQRRQPGQPVGIDALYGVQAERLVDSHILRAGFHQQRKAPGAAGQRGVRRIVGQRVQQQIPVSYTHLA